MVDTSVNLDSISTTATDREWSVDFMEGVLEWGGKESNYDCDGSARLYSEVRRDGGAMGLTVRYDGIGGGYYENITSRSNIMCLIDFTL